MGKRKLYIGLAVIAAALFFVFGQTAARNIWYMPDENKGTLQLHTLRAKEIRAPQAQGNPALTIYSHTLSGTISGTATNNATLTGGTHTSPTITSPTVSNLYESAAKVKLITFSDLSSFSGQAATAGNSIYQINPADGYNIFRVDPHYIATGGVEGGGTTAFGVGSSFTGVTVVAPDADAYPAFWFKVEYAHATDGAITATSGDGSGGVSTVWVVPFAGTGATAYGAEATASLPQAMLFDSATSPFATPAITKGQHDGTLDLPGESKTYRLQAASAVSIYAVEVLKNN